MKETTSVSLKMRGIRNELFLRKDKTQVGGKDETEVNLMLRSESGHEFYIMSISKNGSIYRNPFVDPGHGLKVDSNGLVKFDTKRERDEIKGDE